MDNLAKANIPAEVRKGEFSLVPEYGGAAVNSNYEVLVRLGSLLSAELFSLV
jgi:hypothetical protein|tara:strand:+ start:37 stop:192 length:156 start_codon:yes stop_codon:yes gene_type:complete